jgi:hypothetical protein
MNAKEQFLAVLNNTLPDLNNEVKAVTPAELGVQYVLHISDNPKITEFTPSVPYRAVKEQDHRLPRVCVSTVLTGCIIGYNGISNDLMGRTWDDPKYLGGYVIYGFQPEIVVTPSTNLLSDQHVTEEQWLVSYNPETAHYKPETLGKIFLKSITIAREETADKSSETGMKVQYDYEIYVEVFPGNEIPWTLEERLKEGYYKIHTKGLMMSHSCLRPNPYEITQIVLATYLTAKNLTASLLNYQVPPSMKW